MKTAVSIPQAIFASAEALAKRLGVSRSHLYATALSEYVARFQSIHITEQLDAVYARQDSHLEHRLVRAQRLW